MDQKKCEMSGMVMSSEESAFALQTPQKVGEPLSSRTEVADNSRYETIVELFDHMTCSLRLLDLCKKSPTFGNVSAQVEVLAKRKFIFSHLAQIKFILPEVIQIEKLLIYDKKTLCMRPDMKITVQLDAIEKCHEQSGFRALRELFMSRLVDYFTDHPEASVVPEAMLPGPFHQGYQISDIQDTLKDSVFQRQSTVTDGIILSESSGLPESFSRHFSQKVVLSEKTQLLASPITFSSSSFANPTNQELRGRKEGHSNGVHLEPITEINHSVCSKQEEEASFSFCRSAIIVPSVESPYPCSSVDPIAKESPAGKFSSASENLMIATPAQMTPKRSISGCDNNTKSMSNKQCWSCQKPAKRSLDFSSLKGDRSSMDRSETCKHVHDYSPCSLKLVKEKNLSGFAGLLHQLQENERGRLSEDQISTKQSLRMCQDLSYLNGIAATVNYVFQSVGCSSITREELVHKIIMNNCEVLERKEVEEQVELLGKLFPDWFYRRSTHSGDIMYSIREGTSLESIKSRLIGS